MNDQAAADGHSWGQMLNELAKLETRTCLEDAERCDAVAQRAKADGDTRRAAYAEAMTSFHRRRQHAAQRRCWEAARERAATTTPRPALPRPKASARRPRSRARRSPRTSRAGPADDSALSDGESAPPPEQQLALVALPAAVEQEALAAALARLAARLRARGGLS